MGWSVTAKPQDFLNIYFNGQFNLIVQNTMTTNCLTLLYTGGGSLSSLQSYLRYSD